MKFKLVEYPYGMEMGFKQDIVWFIQGTDDNISLEIKYNYDNIGDFTCDATPEEIELVKNIIEQIQTNEKTKGFSWRSYDK